MYLVNKLTVNFAVRIHVQQILLSVLVKSVFFYNYFIT